MRFYHALIAMLLALFVWFVPSVSDALPPRPIWLRMCGAEFESKVRGAASGAFFERDLEGSGVSMREWMEQCSASEHCEAPGEGPQTEQSTHEVLKLGLSYCTPCVDRATARGNWLASAYNLESAIAHPPASLRAAQRRYCVAVWESDDMPNRIPEK